MLSSFLDQLFEGRAIQVDVVQLADRDDEESALGRLVEFDQGNRLNAAHLPPPLDHNVALWAAYRFRAACCFAVYRDIHPDVINEAMNEAPPDRLTAAAHYSADLTFRFLPQLVQMARSALAEDPLIDGLTCWAKLWPLSSVGMKFPSATFFEDSALEPIVNDPSLCQTYVDRVIQARDAERLSHPGVADQVRAAIGVHATLAPELNAALNSPHCQN